MRTARTARPVLGWALATVVVACVLGACGSGGGDATLVSGSPGPATADGGGGAVSTLPPAGGGNLGKPACELLSQQDVAQLMGNAVGAGQTAGRACFWGTQVDKGTSATLTVVAPAAGKAADECNAQRNSLPKEATADNVGGLGNSAVWVWQPVAILVQGTLLACWDDAVVSVFLSGEKDQAALRNVANGMVQSVRSRL
ncbi:MAG: hypothetical protein ACRD2W_12820 [Acidimicrobiales bacterium]